MIIVFSTKLKTQALRLQCWNLLLDVPTNRSMMQELENASSLCATTYVKYVDSTNVYRSLYALQFMYAKFSPPIASDTTLHAAQEWQRAFVSTGGVRAVLRFLKQHQKMGLSSADGVLQQASQKSF